MFEFTITYANGNILTLREPNETHAKGLKREFSYQFDIGLIKGFSLRQNGLIIFAIDRKTDNHIFHAKYNR